MHRALPFILLIAASGITVAGGVIHGRYTHRWGASNDLSLAAQRLTDFPTTIGNWQTRDAYKLSQPVIDIIQCSGYLNRRFTNNVTGETVNVAILLGPAGPISVHVPEVCYSSRDYTLISQRQAIVIRDKSGTTSNFWSTTFESTGLDKSLLQVMFAWTTDGRWQAADNPRFEFAGQPYLFKIQLASTLPSNAKDSANDACRNFLHDFVPALNQHLFRGISK